ncbi:hypothetical protein ACB092_01G385100 [Castanea dentata]
MDVIYCLPFYLFSKKPIGHPRSDAFISTGKDPNSPHKIAVKCCENLKNYSQHINKLIEKQTSKELENNRLRLKTSIECAQWLAFQACAFRVHDESLDSKNRGNFIELIKFTSTFNDKVASVVFKNAPRNAKYTSPTIQKEILHILASNDESKKKQMTIILRFVDKNGFLKEHFFHVVHKEICAVLSRHNLHIENIRGQGVDGASNMRGEWNGLQALFLKECPYAYYVHCMAHRLQLALVIASREVKIVHQFFDYLSNIINIVAGDTCWGSHFQSICSLIKMFDATCKVINTISKEWANYKQRDDAEGAYQVLTSFEFVLILHMMKEIMGITNILCQALQQHSQDLLNAMHLVSTTKSLIQKLRDDGWEPLLDSVTSFCGQHEIDIPDLNTRYTKARVRYRHQDEALTTIEHHLRIDIFTLTADLLTLSSALNPKDAFRSFKIGDIYNLAKNYYPQDFTEQEICLLKYQLQHYELDVTKHPNFQNMSTISELCRELEISGKSKIYHLIDRLIRLVLTLPVSTTTTERAFLAMKLLKTRLRNRMEDELLVDNMIVYIEKEIAGNFTMEMIMSEFYSMKNRRQT